MAESQDILLLCSNEDDERAAKIAKIIEGKGVSLSKFDSRIERDAGAVVGAAKCVACIVSEKMEWSPTIRDIILESLKRKSFVGLKADDARLPEELRDVQIVDLKKYSDGDYKPWYKFLTAIRKVTGVSFPLDELPSGEPGLKQPFVKNDGQAYMYYGAATTGVWLASEEFRRQKEVEAKESDAKAQASIIVNRQTEVAPDICVSDSAPRVFISYSRKDRAFVESLNKAFESFMLPDWWDEDIAPGDEWRSEIINKLGAVNYILVVWSKNSVSSDWVLLEAKEARKRGRLLGLKIDDCVIPEPFSQAETVDFAGKELRINDPSFREFFKRIGELTHSDLLARIKKFEALEDGVVAVL